MPTIHSVCKHCSAPVVRKQSAANYFCDTSCKAQWQMYHGKPVSEDWLRDAYLVKKMDCTVIAGIVGRDPKSVWTWLKNFGIETRKRGTTGNHVYSIGVARVLTDAGRKRLSEGARAARLVDGRKPYIKNGKHWLHHDGAKHPNWRGGITPERQALYSSQEWKDSVKSVWARDGFACVRCHVDLRHRRGECAIHHIESFAVREKRTLTSNLILLCKACHLWVHSKRNTDKEFIK